MKGASAMAAVTGAILMLGGLLSAFAAAPTTAEPTWTKVSSRHFTILTSADEATARAWAIEFEQFRRGMQTIVPVPTDKLRPVTVVLFRNEREMQPYLPLENGKPARMGGLFVRADEINTIMLSLAGEQEDIRHTVFHEAVHWHLSAFEGPMPLWLGEGLAEVCATFELEDARTYSFGQPIQSYVAMMQREPVMPLPRLFGTGRESLLYNEGTRASIFYAQSWAFAHYLFFGEGSPGPGAIMRYLKLLRTTHNADEAFEQAVGTSYGEIERRLGKYIRRGRYRVHKYPRTTDDIARLLQVGRPAPADLELAKGSLLLGTGNVEPAEVHFWRAVALAPADARGWELLGHIAIGRRDYDEAKEVLKRAAEAGSTNYLVYHNLGVAHFPPPAVPGFAFHALDDADVEKAAANYREAIRLAPAHVGSYEGLAGLMHGKERLAAEDLALLAKGLLLSPGNATIETGIAAGEIRAGRGREGRARLERLVQAGAEGDRGVEFARKVLARETLNAEKAEMDALARKGKFDDALAVARRALARETDATQRSLLEAAEVSLTQYRTIAGAAARANRGETEAARAELDALLAKEPEPPIRADAERLLRQIEKHEEQSRAGGDGAGPRR